MSKETVLIVDDEKPHRLLTRRAFGNTDAMILEAENISQAKDHLTSQPVTLVLLDVNLGPESGIDLLNFLQSIAELSHIPVLMLSTSEMESDQCLKLGAKQYVVKSLDPSRYKSELSKAIMAIRSRS